MNEHFQILMHDNNLTNISSNTFAAISKLTSQLNSFELHISLNSFVNLLRKDICNVKSFKLKNFDNILTIPDLNMNSNDPLTKMDREFLNNCQLRLLMAQLNIFIWRIIYPPFGFYCSGVKLKDC